MTVCTLCRRPGLVQYRPEVMESSSQAGGPDMKNTRLFMVVAVLLVVCAGFVYAAAAVRIREWPLPSTDRFPHDPAVAPDGALWFTGMGSNTLGRLDTATGTFRSYPVRTPDSGPHGLVADRKGNIWFTANYKGYIGRLDPATGVMAEYPLPDKKAKDPHTPVFDQKGELWFTVQEGNFVGRLNPADGKIVLVHPPTDDARPYGIAVNAEGVPFFCEFGANKIGRINPVTMAIKEYELPDKGARPRRLAIDGRGQVWYTDYQRGYLGRLDPGTGKVSQWQSPGGKKSAPYAIAVRKDGTVWYSETGVKPNTIVRFDPGSARFSRWPVPSGGGVIRNMVATPAGNLYIACSGKNRVGEVVISR
jgi:virginiamycin B lyase